MDLFPHPLRIPELEIFKEIEVGMEVGSAEVLGAKPDEGSGKSQSTTVIVRELVRLEFWLEPAPGLSIWGIAEAVGWR